MTPLQLIIEAARRGLRLKVEGGKLSVSAETDDRLRDSFIETLRENKPALLRFLSGALTPDCKPWIWIAVQVLAGEWDGADQSARQSLVIGLRSVPHPLCAAALERVTALA